MGASNSSSSSILLQLYEAAIDRLDRAEKASHASSGKAQKEFHTQLVSCQKIMHQLMSSIDVRNGGEAEGHLFRMYDFINYQLVRANILKESGELGAARKLLLELRGRAEKESALCSRASSWKGGRIAIK